MKKVILLIFLFLISLFGVRYYASNYLLVRVEAIGVVSYVDPKDSEVVMNGNKFFLKKRHYYDKSRSLVEPGQRMIARVDDDIYAFSKSYEKEDIIRMWERNALLVITFFFVILIIFVRGYDVSGMRP